MTDRKTPNRRKGQCGRNFRNQISVFSFSDWSCARKLREAPWTDWECQEDNEPLSNWSGNNCPLLERSKARGTLPTRTWKTGHSTLSDDSLEERWGERETERDRAIERQRGRQKESIVTDSVQDKDKIGADEWMVSKDNFIRKPLICLWTFATVLKILLWTYVFWNKNLLLIALVVAIVFLVAIDFFQIGKCYTFLKRFI